MTTSCADCLDDLDHCHGTLVVDPDGMAECTDDNCRDIRPERHLLCTDIP
jgi:hypothetical protein